MNESVWESAVEWRALVEKWGEKWLPRRRVGRFCFVRYCVPCGCIP